MKVSRIVNPLFGSNTYVISEAGTNWVWLIDIGDLEAALGLIPPNGQVKGVFITHSHFDHIYGLNLLVDKFPCCTVYISEFAREGLYCAKLNMSYYHELPMVFKGLNTCILKESDKVKLFEKKFLDVLETPGHNEGCLTFIVENYLFTGDSYIPNVKVVTKLKGGNRDANMKSLGKIKNIISQNTILCPGHGKPYVYSECLNLI
jgi:hydroxyacylglutathione hydrolase